MGKDLTIKVNAKVFYWFIALLAILGIFAIAIWVGMYYSSSSESSPAGALSGGDTGPGSTFVGQSGEDADGPASALSAGGELADTSVGNAGAAADTSTQQGAVAATGGEQGTSASGSSSDSADVVREVMKGLPPASAEEVPIAPGQPRLWLGEVGSDQDFTFDIGTVSGIEVTTYEIPVTNIGEGTLVIQRTSSDCGCTIPEIQETTLEPGESTILSIAYDPKVLQEQGQFVKKTVQVASNDPERPVVEFSLMAEVDTK